jgi:redox-sensitive bicupin YhaK (pirin superfamily)
MKNQRTKLNPSPCKPRFTAACGLAAHRIPSFFQMLEAKGGIPEMITVRRSHQRGHADHGWLNSYHTFSFADYHDPNQMGFRSLRVMNEDRVSPGQGFGEHPHRDMEIVSYVLDGALQHRDSMGNGSVLHAGDFQRITAGRGVLHSEFNPSATEPVHFYQIWLFPNERGLDPSYEERSFSPSEKQNRLRLVASRDGREGSLTVHQDADVFLSTLEAGTSVSHQLRPGRHAWVQVMRGSIRVGDTMLGEGDAAAISDQAELQLVAVEPAEVMLFDLD